MTGEHSTPPWGSATYSTTESESTPPRATSLCYAKVYFLERLQSRANLKLKLKSTELEAAQGPHDMHMMMPCRTYYQKLQNLVPLSESIGLNLRIQYHSPAVGSIELISRDSPSATGFNYWQ
ncbi:hypothetical protein D9758_002834 [Tetrapyrgos nigripes]|uniref:Uncharacterized protein n=1 Tax=Tetrapyrgos nigripes TaxID=182062 RepID=A0A8H5LSY9_9AGAR|nr:hypothetical protein D9758_002834 [Tetrapyrgos nigripes]